MESTIQNTDKLFDGQEFHLGIDAHKKNLKVQIRNQGRILKRFTMNPEPDKLKEYLVKNYPAENITVYMKRDSADIGYIEGWLKRV